MPRTSEKKSPNSVLPPSLPTRRGPPPPVPELKEHEGKKNNVTKLKPRVHGIKLQHDL